MQKRTCTHRSTHKDIILVGQLSVVERLYLCLLYQFFCIFPSAWLSLCLSTHVFSLSICLFVCLSISMFIFSYTYLYMCLFVCVYLSFGLFFLFIWLLFSLYLFFYQFVLLYNPCLFVCHAIFLRLSLSSSALSSP